MSYAFAMLVFTKDIAIEVFPLRTDFGVRLFYQGACVLKWLPEDLERLKPGSSKTKAGAAKAAETWLTDSVRLSAYAAQQQKSLERTTGVLAMIASLSTKGVEE